MSRMRSIQRVSVALLAAVATALVLVTAQSPATAAPATGTAPAPANAPKQCVGSAFATLGEIFDAQFDSLLPSLPPAMKANAQAFKTQAHHAMQTTGIANTAVSNHPYGLGGDQSTPMMTYREPLSTYIVAQLLNIKNGQSGARISVENLTLSQAVETAYLYLYVGFYIPAMTLYSTIPNIYSIGGVISVGSLVALPLLLGAAGMNLIFKTLTNQIANACIVSVTQSQKEHAGKPDMDLHFTQHVPAMLKGFADQIALADRKNCPSIGSQPMSTVVARTSDYLKKADPKNAAMITDRTARLQEFMKLATVPQGIIPADPQDFSTIETVLSYAMTLVPYAGGAILNSIIGLNHKNHDPSMDKRTVPLSQLPVATGLTAVYYAYAISTQLMADAWGLGVSALGTVVTPIGGVINPFALIPLPFGVLNAPNLYGVATVNDVLRSVCYVEDRKPA